MAIEELEITPLCDRYGNVYGRQYPRNKDLMDKINEIITYINNKEAADLTKNSKNMRIYYFIGNKVKGIDLTSNLEDISRISQKAITGLTIKELRSLKEFVDPNSKAIEGEHEDRLYYLHNYVIKWCKKRSLKALLIRLIGVNIEKQ